MEKNPAGYNGNPYRIKRYHYDVQMKFGEPLKGPLLEAGIEVFYPSGYVKSYQSYNPDGTPYGKPVFYEDGEYSGFRHSGEPSAGFYDAVGNWFPADIVDEKGNVIKKIGQSNWWEYEYEYY